MKLLSIFRGMKMQLSIFRLYDEIAFNIQDTGETMISRNISRNKFIRRLNAALERNRVVVLTGPRQSGKTTLARQLVQKNTPNYFDLEDPISLDRLNQPMTALAPLRGLVVVDEVQRRPDLFPVLRVLADREGQPAKFLILGSASGDLLRQSSESLAGRAARLTLNGFHLSEVGAGQSTTLWLRGGLPRSHLARDDDESFLWREQYVQDLLERDFPQWGVRTSATALRRFWNMLVHYHGQVWNASPPARAIGVSPPTIRRYLDRLTDAFMIRQLPPYHTNLGKRQIKSPKIYIRDSGILHQLLTIKTEGDLITHPALGASWEGFVIEQLLTQLEPNEAYFWGIHQGAEIDLVLRWEGRWIGVECKRKDAPHITDSIRAALDELDLEHVVIVYPGETPYSLNERVHVMPFRMLESAQEAFAQFSIA